MRFKLDENLPVELAAELRAIGYHADTVADEGLCGEADPADVEAATIAGRILLTLDKGIADVRGQSRATLVLFRPDSAGRRAVLSFVRERISRIASMDLAGGGRFSSPIRLRCSDALALCLKSIGIQRVTTTAFHRPRTGAVLILAAPDGRSTAVPTNSGETIGLRPIGYRINGLSQTRKSSLLSWAKSLGPSSAIHSRSMSRSRS